MAQSWRLSLAVADIARFFARPVDDWRGGYKEYRVV